MQTRYKAAIYMQNNRRRTLAKIAQALALGESKGWGSLG
jgi:hypothetical protein